MITEIKESKKKIKEGEEALAEKAKTGTCGERYLLKNHKGGDREKKKVFIYPQRKRTLQILLFLNKRGP